MDKPKAKMDNSMSSNGALTNNEILKNKSKSLEVQKTLNNEGKDDKNGTKPSMSSKGSGTKIEQVKPPPRPRPGQKRFLASVLSILSKSTTGTQYPDSEIQKGKKKHKEKKYKYRSKVLNDLEDQIDTNFDVIQYKKDIIQTPSVYSQNSNQEDFKPWELGLPRLVKPDEDELRLKREQNISQLVKEVTEGRMQKEPVKHEITEDKGLYNFFVDLLETTFSVYNVKADINRTASNLSSKVAFEMDENVAKKLKVSPNTDDVTQKPSNNFYCEPNAQAWKQEQRIDFFQSSPSSMRSQISHPRPKKKITSRSFDYVKQIRRPNTQSTESRRKSLNRNTRKENLLNLLKEQLSMDFDPFDKPPNLFQSLQVMAQHKRKTQKSLRFDRSTKLDDEYIELMKRRKRLKEESSKKRSQMDETSEDEVSVHSLEVYGFDYEHPYIMKPEKREKKLLFTYHSSSSESDGDFEPYEHIALR